MTIPQATLDTITTALKAEGLTGQLEPPVAPDETIQKSLARHADKEAVWYADASLVTPAAKRNIMKALGSLGVTVTAYGVLIPTDANGASEPEKEVEDSVEPPAAVAAPETLEADGAADTSEAAPDAAPQVVMVEPLPELPVEVVNDALPAKSTETDKRKVSTIKLDILPADLDTLLNDINVTILCTGFNGDKLNVAYYREV